MKLTQFVLIAELLTNVASGQILPQAFEQTFHRGWVFPDDDLRRVQSIPDVATPHISWAKPFATGPIKVLVVATGANGRWPVELSQRFDFQVRVVYAVTRDQFGSKDARKIAQGEIDVEARLLQAMDDSITVFVSEVPMGILGEKVRTKLVELLKQGVGYIGPVEGLDVGIRKDAAADAQDMVRSAAPVPGLQASPNGSGKTETAESPIVRLWDSSNEGRIADIRDFRRDGRAPDADRLQYLWLPKMDDEAWYSLMGRAILWSAKRIPARSSVSVSWPEKAIERRDMPYRLPVVCDNSHTLKIRIWDADGQLHYEGSDPRISPLPAGRYFGGVQVLNGSVQDWAFGTFAIHNEVEIATVELNSRYQDQNQPVKVRTELSHTPPDGYKLVLICLGSA